MLVFMDRACAGPPVALLTCGWLGRDYELRLLPPAAAYLAPPQLAPAGKADGRASGSGGGIFLLFTHTSRAPRGATLIISQIGGSATHYSTLL